MAVAILLTKAILDRTSSTTTQKRKRLKHGPKRKTPHRTDPEGFELLEITFYYVRPPVGPHICSRMRSPIVASNGECSGIANLGCRYHAENIGVDTLFVNARIRQKPIDLRKSVLEEIIADFVISFFKAEFCYDPTRVTCPRIWTRVRLSI